MQHEVEIIRGFVGAADLVDAFHLFYPPSSMDNVIVTSLKETYGAADTECYQSPERAQMTAGVIYCTYTTEGKQVLSRRRYFVHHLSGTTATR